MRYLLSRVTLITCCLASLNPSDVSAKSDAVQVFILAGQSNMEGKASLETLKRQIRAPRTRQQFAHLHDGRGNFVARDDVFITFFDRHGPLEATYGSPGRFGPELGFGWTVGEALRQPVLIIKVAWGGRSLYRDFRPPSAGMPNEEQLAEDLKVARRRDPAATLDEIRQSYGRDYRALLDEVARVQDNCATWFPKLQGKQLQLAGFVWFQGWNDMINQDYSQAYAENMAHFINDVRRDLDAPTLPFVIGQLGVDGPYAGDDAANDKREQFKSQQAAAAQRPEFAGNVALVKTDQYWDPEAAEAFKTWNDDIEAWRNFGDDRPYHYLGSPKIIYEIGQAFGEAVLELNSNKSR